MYVKYNNVWIDLAKAYMKVNGEWVRANVGYAKINGVWVKLEGFRAIRNGYYTDLGDIPYTNGYGLTACSDDNNYIWLFGKGRSDVYKGTWTTGASHALMVHYSFAVFQPSQNIIRLYGARAVPVGAPTRTEYFVMKYNRSTMSYTVETMPFQHTGDYNVNAYDITGCLYQDRYAYVYIGDGARSQSKTSQYWFYKHDTNTNTWTLLASGTSTSTFTLQSMRAVYDNDKTIYFLRGKFTNSSGRDMLTYNITTNTFSVGSAYLNYPDAIVNDAYGNVLVSAIFDGEQNIFIYFEKGQLWSYDIRTREWYKHQNFGVNPYGSGGASQPYSVDPPSMVFAHDMASPTDRKKDKIYFLGGRITIPYDTSLSSFYSYTNFRV